MGKVSQKKIKIGWFNPSSRKNEYVSLEEVYTGVIKYTEGNFTCLIGVETEACGTDTFLTEHHLHPGQRRRISHLQWDVSWGTTKVGEKIRMSPRDIAIAYAVITYLKKRGFFIP